MTGAYNQDKSVSFPHVSKMTLLAPVSLTASDRDSQICRYNETMKKPWVYKRKNIKGWWCGWYEGGKRKA
jgi:hypothetical protein